MKIICDNCGAKYSIADEKVQGRTFKIRCKKCQESIVVKGDTAPVEEPSAQETAPKEGGEIETRVFDYSGYKGENGDIPIWYVAVDGGEQQGPYTTNQMREYFAEGNIIPESYVWKEGFDDWKTAGEIPEIAGQPRQGQASSESQAGEQAQGAGLFDAGPTATAQSGGLFETQEENPSGGLFDTDTTSSRGSLFDGSSDAPEGGLFANAQANVGGEDIFSSAPTDTATGGLFSAQQDAQAVTKDGGGLFDGPDASAGGGDLFSNASSDDAGGIFASTEAAGPKVSTVAAMTGQRNENSVLFSLSNLQALASDTLSSSHEKEGLNLSGTSSSNEASGLIDIRAMASSLALEAEKADDVDEMLSMGGGGFVPTLGAPVLTATGSQGMSMTAKIGIAAGIVIVLAAIVVFTVITLQKDTSASEEKIALLMQQIEQMKSQGASAEEIQNKMNELDQVQKTTPSTGTDSQESKTKEETAEKEAEEAKTADQTASQTQRRTTTTSRAASSSPEPSDDDDDKKEESKAAASQPTPRKTTALDDLLGGTPKSSQPAKTAAPEKLSRQQVMQGMNAVAGAVQKCGAGRSGTFRIRATIAPNGKVTSAVDVGDFSGTPVGTCAANAVSRATFPQSSSPTTVTFPFKI